MSQLRAIALIDGNPSRRAAISYTLYGQGLHVEPFHDVSETAQRWPRGDVMLVEDDGRKIAELSEAMTGQGRWLPVIAFSDLPQASMVVRAMLDGAIDYFEWPRDAERVPQMVAAAATTGAALASDKLREARARSRVRRLTRREREVLAGVADGLSNRLIGERLEISPRTVEIHRANLLNKIGAAHTSEAIRVAIEARLVA